MASYMTVTIWSIFCDDHSNDKKKYERLAQKGNLFSHDQHENRGKNEHFFSMVFMLTLAKC